MKKFIFILIAISVFTSCKTYQKTWLSPSNKETKTICFTHVDAEEVIASIPKKIQVDFGESIFEAWENAISYKTIPIKKSNSSSLFKMSENDKYNMLQNYFTCNTDVNDTKIYPLRLKVTIFETAHHINKVYLLPTVLTLTTINLLGFPIISHKVKFEVKGEIYDHDNNLIKTYYDKGEKESFAAYYWGYTGVSAVNKTSKLGRVSTTLALKDALEKLNTQILNDKSHLTELIDKY